MKNKIQQLNDDLTLRCGFFKSPISSSLGLLSELGELVDIVRKLEGDKVIKDTDDISNLKGKLGSEIADVLVYLGQVATHYGIDIETAFTDKYNLILKRRFING